MTSVDRALLLSEWSADSVCACPCCGVRGIDDAPHAPECSMDLALAERGFATREDRDRAREFVRRKVVESANTLPPPEKP